MSDVRSKWLAFYGEHVEPASKEMFSYVERMIIGALIVSAGAHVSSNEPMIVLFGYLRQGLIGRGVPDRDVALLHRAVGSTDPADPRLSRGVAGDPPSVRKDRRPHAIYCAEN